MQIAEISVTSLFGIFNHIIPLHIDDGITIIHGPNGYGKSVIFKMLDGLFNGHYSLLCQYPFQTFKVCFDDESVVWVDKNREGRKSAMTINFSNPNTTESQYFELDQEPAWWLEIRKLVNVCLIDKQKLFDIQQVNGHRGPTLPIGQEYGSELAAMMQEKLSEVTQLSQSLDRTFLARLTKPTKRSIFTNGTLQNRLKKLEKKRVLLTNIGLLEQEESSPYVPPEQMLQEANNVLDVYVQDVEQKLAVLDDISAKISLFKRIINDWFSHKKINLSKSSGFYFTTCRNEILPFLALSEGEKYVVALLYHLLFRTTPDSLILIDEPESSLHVIWQRDFLRDLQKVAAVASLDFILATHSPQLIHDRWDLTVGLNGASVA